VVKVGLSIVSMENAKENLLHDIKGFDFNSISKSSLNNWNKMLSVIQVDDGQQDDIKDFYTALYHSMVVPNIVSDVNGEYRGHDMITGHLKEGEKQYSTLSIWDTFRAWNPLMTVIDTTLTRT
jgi:Putative alpha-1,2-mannosidase